MSGLLGHTLQAAPPMPPATRPALCRLPPDIHSDADGSVVYTQTVYGAMLLLLLQYGIDVECSDAATSNTLWMLLLLLQLA